MSERVSLPAPGQKKKHDNVVHINLKKQLDAVVPPFLTSSLPYSLRNIFCHGGRPAPPFPTQLTSCRKPERWSPPASDGTLRSLLRELSLPSKAPTLEGLPIPRSTERRAGPFANRDALPPCPPQPQTGTAGLRKTVEAEEAQKTKSIKSTVSGK